MNCWFWGWMAMFGELCSKFSGRISLLGQTFRDDNFGCSCQWWLAARPFATPRLLPALKAFIHLHTVARWTFMVLATSEMLDPPSTMPTALFLTTSVKSLPMLNTRISEIEVYQRWGLSHDQKDGIPAMPQGQFEWRMKGSKLEEEN